MLFLGLWLIIILTALIKCYIIYATINLGLASISLLFGIILFLLLSWYFIHTFKYWLRSEQNNASTMPASQQTPPKPQNPQHDISEKMSTSNQEAKIARKSDLKTLNWVAGILIGIQLIATIIGEIIFGFNWVLIIELVLVIILLGFYSLIIRLSIKHTFLVGMSLILVLAVIFLVASVKDYVFSDTLRSWIDKHVDFNYFVGSLGLYGLVIAIATIYQDYKDRRKL